VQGSNRLTAGDTNRPLGRLAFSSRRPNDRLSKAATSRHRRRAGPDETRWIPTRQTL